MAHKHRQIGVVEHVSCYTAEDHLAQWTVRVCTHHQHICTERMRLVLIAPARIRLELAIHGPRYRYHDPGKQWGWVEALPTGAGALQHMNLPGIG